MFWSSNRRETKVVKQEGQVPTLVGLWSKCILWKDRVKMAGVCWRSGNVLLDFDKCASQQNKSDIFNEKPSVRYKTTVIIKHVQLQKQSAGISCEMMNWVSVFQRELDERQKVNDTVLYSVLFNLPASWRGNCKQKSNEFFHPSREARNKSAEVLWSSITSISARNV